MYSFMTKHQAPYYRVQNPFNQYLYVKNEKKPTQEKEKEKNEPKTVRENDNIQKTNQKSDIPIQEDNQKAAIKEKMIYLTFDDGPSAYTDQIIESLKKFDMKATFFMLEPNMRAYPEQLQAIINAGHVPALHGVSHNTAIIYQSEKTVVDEMVIAQATLKNLTGQFTHLIRTPYGSAPYMKPSYKQAVEEAGFQLWDWTVDSEDWKYRNGEFVIRVIQQLENFQFKERPLVILLHDRKSTAEHLPDLLTYLKAKGYETELLNEQLTAYHF